MKITVVFFYLCLIKCFSSAGKSFERERNVFLLFLFLATHVASGAFFSHQYSQNGRLSSLSLRSRIDQPHSAISFRRKPRDNRECVRERELSLYRTHLCCYYQVAIFQKKVLARHRFVYNVRALAPERGESVFQGMRRDDARPQWVCRSLIMRREPIEESDKRKKFYSFSNASCRDESRQRCAICVQNPDDSLRSAIHIVFRVSLRSSSFTEPRHPPNQIILFL